MSIATYSDGTVSIENGQGIIMPDGTIHVNGNLKQNNGPIQIPSGGSSIEINGGSVQAVNGEFYISANGSVLYIDAEGTASAWDAP